MSATPETFEKPKRKYTRKADKPDAAARAEPDALALIPSEDAPTHSTPCCVIKRSYMEKSPVNDEMIRRYDRCGEESTWTPKIVFKGRELRLRKNEEGKPEQYRGSKMYTMPVQWQPVCNTHKKAIEKNPKVILSNEWVRSQTRSFIDMGFPPPEAGMTKMVWSRYEYEEPEMEADALDVLMGIANERASLADAEPADALAAITQEDDDT